MTSIRKRLAKLEAESDGSVEVLVIFQHIINKLGDEPAYGEFGDHDEEVSMQWCRPDRESVGQFYDRIEADLPRIAPGRQVYQVRTFPVPIGLNKTSA